MAITPNGRYVVFESEVSNLVPGDTNGIVDVFVWDRTTGAIDRVSTTSSGTEGTAKTTNGAAIPLDVSDDGRYVLFGSEATNLVPSDRNGIGDIFRKDRTTGALIRVSLDPAGNEFSTAPTDAYMSADGRYVAFNVDTQTGEQSYVRDIALGDTVRIDSAELGTAGSVVKGITGDGSSVLLNLAYDPSGGPGLVVEDLSTHALDPVDISNDGTALGGKGQYLSEDGRYVTFTVQETYGKQGYLRDRQNGTTRRFSENSSGEQGMVQGNLVGLDTSAVTPSGRYVFWSSDATNLVPGTYCSGGMSCADYLYRRDMKTGQIDILNKAADGEIINDNNGYVWDLAVSDNGEWVAFDSVNSGSLLVPGATNGDNVFLADAPTMADLAPPAIPAGQTYGGFGYSEFAPRPVSYMSDPVNTATGAFSASATDAALPGIGVPDLVTRTYNSADDRAGLLGRGWSLSVEASLRFGDAGAVTFIAGDGQRVFFQDAGDGTYTAEDGATAQLSQAADQTFQLTTRQQKTYAFDTTGRLTGVTDRNGQGLSMSYDSQGNLASVQGSGGRIQIQTSGGLLSRVTMPNGRHVDYDYTTGSDGISRLSSVRDLAGGLTNYAYDAGQLTSITNPDGHVSVRLAYDATSGRVTDQWDGNNNHTTFAWDPQTQTATMTTPRGGKYTDTYQNSVLVSETNPLGATTSYSYDDQLHLIAMTDPRGNEARWGYNDSGNLIWEELLDGATLHYTYNSLGEQVTSTNARGTTVRYSYDQHGNPIGTSWPDPNGPGRFTTSLVRDPATGLVTSSTDQRGKVTRYDYDKSGNLVSITDPAGDVTTNTFDGDGRLVSTVSGRGNQPGADPDNYRDVTLLDDLDRPIAEVDALGKATVDSFTRGDATQLGSTEAGRNWSTLGGTFGVQNGAAYLASSSGGANLAVVTDPADATVSFTEPTAQGGLGVAFRVQDQNNYWRLQADPAETTWQLIKTVVGTETVVGATPPGSCCAANARLTVSYVGNQIDVSIDGATKLTVSDADLAAATKAGIYAAATGAGRLDDLLIAAPGATTSYSYDAVGNLLSRTDPNGHTTRWTYDNTERQTSQSSPLAGVGDQSWTYNADGQVASYTDRKDNQTQFQYDLADQLTETSGPQGTWQFGYDNAGNRTSITDPGSATTHLSYDEMNRLTSITYPDGTAPVTYTYDNNGNRSSMTDGAGKQTYSYDALDRLVSVTRGTDTFTYAYDAANNLTSRSAPGQTPDTYTYDDNGRLNSVASGGTTQATYSYDPDGNPTNTILADGYTETRTYDPADRLTGISNVKGNTVLTSSALTLDPVGNPTHVTDQANKTTTYTYDAGNRLTKACFNTDTCTGAIDDIGYTYDDNNNITSQASPSGTTTYTYNPADQLTSSTGPGGTTNYGYDSRGDQTTAGAATSYSWNAAGEITSATTGTTKTTYTYDGDGRRTSASTGTRATDTTALLWDPLSYQLALERNGSGSVLRRYVYGSQVLSEITGGNTYYYHHDSLGSIAALTDSNGNAQWLYNYDPYGAARSTSQLNSKAPTNPLRYAAQYADPAGSSYYLRSRTYDPTTGRFLSADPAADTTSGPYGYLAGNPMTGTDPYGLCCSIDWGGLVEGVNHVAEAVTGIATIAAIGCAAVVVCAPAEPVIGGIALAAGAVAAGTGIYMAYDTCSSGKGSCPGAILHAAIDTTSALGIGAGVPGLSSAAETAPEMASGLVRTGTALSESDAFHRSVSWVVDNPAAQRFAIKGGDGVSRELYQLPGEVNGKSGVFEWIIDRSGTNPVINHQRFIPGGSVTGYPNQVVP